MQMSLSHPYVMLSRLDAWIHYSNRGAKWWHEIIEFLQYCLEQLIWKTLKHKKNGSLVH